MVFWIDDGPPVRGEELEPPDRSPRDPVLTCDYCAGVELLRCRYCGWGVCPRCLFGHKAGCRYEPQIKGSSYCWGLFHFWAWGWSPGPVFSQLWLGAWHLCFEHDRGRILKVSAGWNRD